MSLQADAVETRPLLLDSPVYLKRRRLTDSSRLFPHYIHEGTRQRAPGLDSLDPGDRSRASSEGRCADPGVSKPPSVRLVSLLYVMSRLLRLETKRITGHIDLYSIIFSSVFFSYGLVTWLGFRSIMGTSQHAKRGTKCGWNVWGYIANS
ncbi:hypothetical protein F5B21DRAFT_314697 [Xylaria acuta]|nr:hypothetical protein F5B21DRAFT_314697 [Xylaria acuta]